VRDHGALTSGQSGQPDLPPAPQLSRLADWRTRLRVRVTDRDSQCIGGVVRRRRGVEAEQELHHVLELRLLRAPVADDGEFDRGRCVLTTGVQPAPLRARRCRARSQQQRAPSVA
jgi:hypothetical protein